MQVTFAKLITLGLQCLRSFMHQPLNQNKEFCFRDSMCFTAQGKESLDDTGDVWHPRTNYFTGSIGRQKDTTLPPLVQVPLVRIRQCPVCHSRHMLTLQKNNSVLHLFSSLTHLSWTSVSIECRVPSAAAGWCVLHSEARETAFQDLFITLTHLHTSSMICVLCILNLQDIVIIYLFFRHS